MSRFQVCISNQSSTATYQLANNLKDGVIESVLTSKT